jgi:ribosome maturation factor RimP
MKDGTRQGDDLVGEVEALVGSIGYSLVEFQVSRHRGSVQAKAVIYCTGGTGTKECAAVHRLIFPRLQVLLENPDPYLEVASPGIDRILKEPKEFGIFAGRGVRIWLKDASDWILGRIDSFDGAAICVAKGGEIRKIPIDSVVKARLDYSQEVP